MTRTGRGLLIVPAVAAWACADPGSRGAGGDSTAVATPPAGAPADATPWQVGDTLPRDSASLRH